MLKNLGHTKKLQVSSIKTSFTFMTLTENLSYWYKRSKSTVYWLFNTDHSRFEHIDRIILNAALPTDMDKARIETTSVIIMDVLVFMVTKEKFGGDTETKGWILRY